MHDTFHRFIDLPWELKDQIWNLALRPAHRGAHIFRLYNPQKDEPLDNNIDLFLSPSCHDELREARLAAPVCGMPTRGISWKDNNPSTYLIDGGLWTACKESRLVMERNFQCEKWKPLPRNDQERRERQCMPREKTRDMPATGYFTGEDGDAHYFTVLPHQDLFILQPVNMNTINWENFNTQIEIGSSWWGFHGLQNIALEYDPERGIQAADGFPDHRQPEIVWRFIRMSLDRNRETNLWFIDYNLTLVDGAVIEENLRNISEEDKNMAFSARDGRFVEVETVDRPSWRDRWKYAEKAEFGPRDFTSIDFVCEIKEAAWHDWDVFESDAISLSHIGLLGWDSRRF